MGCGIEMSDAVKLELTVTELSARNDVFLLEEAGRLAPIFDVGRWLVIGRWLVNIHSMKFAEYYG